MDTIEVNLVTVETLDRPLKVTISRNITLKTLMDLAEQLLKIEVYSLYINSQKLTDTSQINNDDTILALNGLSPQTPTRGFFQHSDEQNSYTDDKVDQAAEVKVVVLGPANAGKTSLILRFVLGFFKTNENRTLIESEYEKSLQVGGQSVIMSILDTAGEFDYDKLSRSWVSNKNAYILALGIDQLDEWPVIQYYHRTIRKFTRNPNIFVLITKIDLNEKMTKTQKSEIQSKIAVIEGYCKDQHLLMFKTSAKVNKKIHEMFLAVANRSIDPERHFSGIEADDDYYKVPFLFRAMDRALDMCLKWIGEVNKGG